MFKWVNIEWLIKIKNEQIINFQKTRTIYSNIIVKNIHWNCETNIETNTSDGKKNWILTLTVEWIYCRKNQPKDMKNTTWISDIIIPLNP